MRVHLEEQAGRNAVTNEVEVAIGTRPASGPHGFYVEENCHMTLKMFFLRFFFLVSRTIYNPTVVSLYLSFSGGIIILNEMKVSMSRLNGLVITKSIGYQAE